VRPKRGHNFDHRLRGERAAQLQAAESKAYDESQTALVARLIERFGTGRFRDDMEQEIWLRLLEGDTEDQIVVALPNMRRQLADIEFGPWGHLSLDASTGREAKHGDTSTWGDLIDQDGRIAGGQAPLPADLQKVRGPRGFYTRPLIKARIIQLAGEGASLRRIAAETGVARNTISRIIGPRPMWGTLRQPNNSSCERCGYSSASHVPSSKARRAGNLRVCPNPVLHCACGGWRSIYSASRCARCRAIGIWKRRLVGVA
jgi:hypothetical protein